MENSNLFAYCGFISALITIIDFITKTVKNAELTLSPISTIGLIIFLLCLILHIIIKNERFYYNMKKIVYYYFRHGDSYSISNKECIYTFISRTEMEYTKKHSIISNVKDLTNFCDKFKWSKEQKIDEIKISSSNPSHKIAIKRVENWHQYNVEFDAIGKKQTEDINISIRNLIDKEKESMLFLSSNVVCRTKRLRLVVRFKDYNLKPKNIRYKIFDNYACDFPLLQEDIKYNEEEHKIEKIESMPIYGYRYEISWDFEND